jgi:predicted O-methyltransferase YrrM
LYQRFNRQIGEEHIKVLLEWAEKLNIEVNRAAVAVMAHRITQLETRMYGRLATSIQDALLRAMVTRAAGGQPRAVLEIGTLFGVGAAALHESLIFDKRGLHLTLIDPLDGYYGKNNADLLTSEPINEAVLRRNLAIAEIDPANVSIINLFSTDQAAIDMAGSQRYDVLIIDGDHSYDGVKHDFDAYSRFVNVGGYIIVDDYGAEEWPEIQRFVDETLKTSSSVEFVGAAWRTAVFRLLPAAQG